jgi:hypothetical protein
MHTIASRCADHQYKMPRLALVCRYHCWTWERLERQLMPACSAAAGRPIATCTVIIDLAGLSMRSFSLAAKRLLGAVTQMDQVSTSSLSAYQSACCRHDVDDLSDLAHGS